MLARYRALHIDRLIHASKATAVDEGAFLPQFCVTLSHSGVEKAAEETHGVKILSAPVLYVAAAKMPVPRAAAIRRGTTAIVSFPNHCSIIGRI